MAETWVLASGFSEGDKVWLNGDPYYLEKIIHAHRRGACRLMNKKSRPANLRWLILHDEIVHGPWPI